MTEYVLYLKENGPYLLKGKASHHLSRALLAAPEKVMWNVMEENLSMYISKGEYDEELKTYIYEEEYPLRMSLHDAESAFLEDPERLFNIALADTLDI